MALYSYVNITICYLCWLEKPVDDEDDGSDSFVDKLVAQVVKNLKVTVFETE